MIITQYLFDSNIYNDYLPVFNDGFAYTKTDIVEDNLVTRTIEADVLPTSMKFGGSDTVTSREQSLLQVLYANTSAVTDMSYMFFNMPMLNYINTASFDTSKATTMNSIFFTCTKLTSLDLSNFDTSNVTNMYQMFYDCSSLNSLDLFSFDTSNVTSMGSMFRNCTKLTSLDLSNFDTSNVTNMGSMFNGCSSLTSLDLSNFDTSKVTDMGSMFYHCESLASLDVSGWDTSNVIYMNSMFWTCRSLKSLDLSHFKTGKVTSINGLCAYCISLASVNVTNWDTSNVANMGGIFYCCQSLKSLDLTGWVTSNVKIMDGIVALCSSLENLTGISNFNTSKVTNISRLFENCYKLKSVDVTNWNTDLTVLTTYTNILAGTNALETINLSYANEDTITVILGSVPSQAITVKATPENVAYATSTAPSNVTVIDVIATMNINTTKQQLIYNVLYDVINGKIKPQTTEELLLYSIMMKGDR